MNNYFDPLSTRNQCLPCVKRRSIQGIRKCRISTAIYAVDIYLLLNVIFYRSHCVRRLPLLSISIRASVESRATRATGTMAERVALHQGELRNDSIRRRLAVKGTLTGMSFVALLATVLYRTHGYFAGKHPLGCLFWLENCATPFAQSRSVTLVYW